MIPSIHADLVPLRVEDTGAIRVGDSRVLLDIVIGAYQRGDAAEVIAHCYPTLQLADVYAVIAYYLRHKEEVDAYVARREKEADELQEMIEANQKPGPSKAELLRRWAERQNSKVNG